MRASIGFFLATTLGAAIFQAEAKNPLLPPPKLNISGLSVPAYFVDFQKAEYQIVLDSIKREAFAISKITFIQPEAGAAVFDLVPEVQSAEIDQNPVNTMLIKTDDRATSLRVVKAHIEPGRHELVLRHKLSEGTKFLGDGVSAGFWFSDIEDRQFLEQYLPTNLEYDQYEMLFHVILAGTTELHRVFTNGKVSVANENEFSVSFSEKSNCSSVYFHLAPVDRFTTAKATFHSIDGRRIPVVIYAKPGDQDLSQFLRVSLKTLEELEKDYGPFPHPQLLVYASNAMGGGMEYAGATITNGFALQHEIAHSYFGRAMMPANGNAGWIDEAIASWRDEKYPKRSHPGFSSARLANFSPYKRDTTMDAYREGRNFISYLASLASESGLSLKGILRDLVREHAFSPISTSIFRRSLEAKMQRDLTEEFRQYVYGRSQPDFAIAPKSSSPYHSRLTQRMRIELLD